MKQFDVTALGELLIDFTQNGHSDQGNFLMEANPGGAPCNVLAMLCKLGKKTAFIGKVGDDFLGRHLKEVVEAVGIDARNLLLDKDIHTTLAFVHTYPDGDRDFSFYRNPGADMCLRADEVREELIAQSRIFHFGSLSLTHPDVREATKKAVAIAKENGCIVSYDPNLRPPLWNTLDEAKEQIAFGMTQCDILKISDNEIEWLTGEKDYKRAAERLKAKYDIPLILVSLGKQGSLAFSDVAFAEVPGYEVDTIETTGAGDTFCACVLHHILEKGFRAYKRQELEEMLTFANAAAAIVTTRKGALAVMPTKEEAETLIRGAAK